MTTTRFDVPEISCDHCKNSLEGALGPVAGVDSVRVDVAATTVTVAHDPQAVPAPQLVNVIEEQGYDVERTQEVS